MNGRRIPVSVGEEYVNELMQTENDELKDRFSWPSDKDAKDFASMSTEDILKKIRCVLPPYHFRCRTTFVISTNTKVVKRDGSKMEGVPESKKGKEASNKRERRKEIENLTKNERLSKVHQYRTNAYWDKSGETKRFDEHRKIHSTEFSTDYGKVAENVLSKFDRVFTFKEGKRRKWAFYNDEYKAVVLVDDSTGQLLTCYKSDDFEDYLKTLGIGYLEVL